MPPMWENHPYITYYLADVFLRLDPPERLAERDYCLEPKEPEQVNVIHYVPEDKRLCRCWHNDIDDFVLTSFVSMMGANETCGIDEPRCNERFEKYDSSTFRKQFNNRMRSRPDLESSVYHQLFDYIAFQLPHNADITEADTIAMHHHDPTKQSNYLYTRNITDVQTTHYEFVNLLPYTQYEIQFRACNDLSGCSSYFLYQERTGVWEQGDHVELTLRLDRVQHDTAHIQILPPLLPSGPTVSYELEHIDPNNRTQYTCITNRQHESRNHTLTIYHLEFGEHQFRVRSISLGSESFWSRARIVQILLRHHQIPAPFYPTPSRSHVPSEHESIIWIVGWTVLAIVAVFSVVGITVTCLICCKCCERAKELTSSKVYDLGPLESRLNAARRSCTLCEISACCEHRRTDEPPVSLHRGRVIIGERDPLVNHPEAIAADLSSTTPSDDDGGGAGGVGVLDESSVPLVSDAPDPTAATPPPKRETGAIKKVRPLPKATGRFSSVPTADAMAVKYTKMRVQPPSSPDIVIDVDTEPFQLPTPHATKIIRPFDLPKPNAKVEGRIQIKVDILPPPIEDRPISLPSPPKHEPGDYELKEIKRRPSPIKLLDNKTADSDEAVGGVSADQIKAMEPTSAEVIEAATISEPVEKRDEEKTDEISIDDQSEKIRTQDDVNPTSTQPINIEDNETDPDDSITIVEAAAEEPIPKTTIKDQEKLTPPDLIPTVQESATTSADENVAQSTAAVDVEQLNEPAMESADNKKANDDDDDFDKPEVKLGSSEMDKVIEISDDDGDKSDSDESESKDLLRLIRKL